MDIDLETTADRRHIQYLIKKQILEETKNIRQELHFLKDSSNTTKQQYQQHHISKPQNKNKKQQKYNKC